MRPILERVRATVRKAVPAAEETISYGMPAFKLRGKVLVYFAAWAQHLGFYATPSGNAAFRKELSSFALSKGSVRFPLDRPIPYGLISRIARFRAQELRQTAGKKKD